MIFMSHEVSFMHRTVYEFLMGSHIIGFIESQSPAHFDDHQFHVRLAALRLTWLVRGSANSCWDLDMPFQHCFSLHELSVTTDEQSKYLEDCQDLAIRHLSTPCHDFGCKHFPQLPFTIADAGLVNFHTTMYVHFYRSGHMSSWSAAKTSSITSADSNICAQPARR